MSVRAVLGRAECGGASVTYQLALFRELRCGSAALPCYLERAKGCNALHTLTRQGKTPQQAQYAALQPQHVTVTRLALLQNVTVATLPQL